MPSRNKVLMCCADCCFKEGQARRVTLTGTRQQEVRMINAEHERHSLYTDKSPWALPYRDKEMLEGKYGAVMWTAYFLVMRDRLPPR